MDLSYRIKQKCQQYFIDEKISIHTLTQCYFFIDLLIVNQIELPDINNVINTKNKTVCFDWEKGNNCFSLEIGAFEFGYFIEVRNQVIKQIDLHRFVLHSGDLLSDLKNFLFFS